MYFIKYTAFLVLLLHQCVVNGFNIFDIDMRFNYLNREINFLNSPLVSDEKITRKHEKTRWIPQEVDHFNSSDNRKWQMKYYEDLKYWSKDGPIYLFLNVESAILGHYIFKEGLMKELAKETQGAMYCLEHRYYGDSNPFINLDTENIKYLNSQQALADIAKLITFLKSSHMYKKSKVVVMGVEYGGNLAAWMKVLYPNIIDAAISISAPVLAKKDFSEYLLKIKDNYEHYGGTKCLKNIEQKIENYDMLLQSPEGINKFKRIEEICDDCDMTVLENQQYFFFVVTLPYCIFGMSRNLIKYQCGEMDFNPEHRLFLNKYLKFNNLDNKECVCYDFKKHLNNIHLHRNIYDSYKYIYQHCTEFGHFATTTSKNQPFINVPLEFYMKVCSGLFGKNFNEKMLDEGVENSNKLYGGLKPNVTKVVFVNGDRDPLSTLSVLKDLPHDAPALVISGLFYSYDFVWNSDSNAIREVKDIVKYLTKKWIEPDDHLN